MKSNCYFIGLSWSDSPVSIHFRGLAEELVRRGHRVVLLVDQQRTDIVQKNHWPHVVTWPSRRPTKWADAGFLSRLIDEYGPDCLIGNFSSVNWLSLMGWWQQVPYRVMWYHTLSSQLAHDAVPSWKASLQRVRKRWLYRFATHLMANSAASRNDLIQYYRIPERKCHVTYFSLPDPLSAGQMRIADSIEPAPQRIVCVGRLDYSKGQDVLLRAVREMKEELTEPEVVLIGDGPRRAELEQLARELGIDSQCRFLGRLPHAQVMEQVAAATVAVTPSRAEAFGLVSVEAFSLGVPVVASRVGGIPEIFSGEREGFLVPPDDPRNLATKLLELLRSPELRAEKSLQARQRFLDVFDARRVIPAQADWFEKLVAGSGRGD